MKCPSLVSFIVSHTIATKKSLSSLLNWTFTEYVVVAVSVIVPFSIDVKVLFGTFGCFSKSALSWISTIVVSCWDAPILIPLHSYEFQHVSRVGCEYVIRMIVINHFKMDGIVKRPIYTVRLFIAWEKFATHLRYDLQFIDCRSVLNMY